jgi:hypothetical protein
VVFALFVAATVRPAKAETIYLVGAEFFTGNSTGTTVNHGYQFDTNSSTIAYNLGVGGSTSKGISIALSEGDNTLSLIPSATGSPPGTYAELGLFFDSSSTSYNPSSSPRTADLVSAVGFNQTAANDFTPIAGTTINSYIYNGSDLANGLTSFIVGDEIITITGFTMSSDGTNYSGGSVTINVAQAVPEPSSLALCGIAGAVGLGIARFRRRRARKSE